RVRGGRMSLTRPKLGPDTYVTAVMALVFSTLSTSKRHRRHLERRTGDGDRQARQRAAGLVGDHAIDARRCDVLCVNGSDERQQRRNEYGGRLSTHGNDILS